jgi:hypothetical protein
VVQYLSARLKSRIAFWLGISAACTLPLACLIILDLAIAGSIGWFARCALLVLMPLAVASAVPLLISCADLRRLSQSTISHHRLRSLLACFGVPFDPRQLESPPDEMRLRRGRLGGLLVAVIAAAALATNVDRVIPGAMMGVIMGLYLWIDSHLRARSAILDHAAARLATWWADEMLALPAPSLVLPEIKGDGRPDPDLEGGHGKRC